MADQENPSLTSLGRTLSFLLVFALLAFGGYILWSRMASSTKSTEAPVAMNPPAATPTQAGRNRAKPSPSTDASGAAVALAGFLDKSA
jgi:hypothetical protein